MKLLLDHGCKILSTPRCICRPIKEDDIHDLFRYINHNKNVLQYFLAPYFEHIEDYSIDSLIQRSKDGILIWVIEVNSEAIGFIIEQTRDESARSIELGYAIGEPYWNQGYISEVMQHICTYLFDECNFHKISLSALIDNLASIRVMEKLGFMKEGICIDEVFYHERFHDVVYYYKINPNETKGDSN